MAGPSGAWGPKVIVMTTSVAVLTLVRVYPGAGTGCAATTLSG
jgi:hypothetical protein